MADYTNSKDGMGAVYPFGQVGKGPWDRLEPLISPERLVGEHLFGIPLVSAMRDPITGKHQVFTDDLLKEYIITAVASLEEELHMIIFPLQLDERHPWDYNHFMQFGFFRVKVRPVSSIQKLAIQSSDGTDFFKLPLQWIETGYLHEGQINILPLSPVAGSAELSGASLIMGGPAASIFMTHLARSQQIPAYWTITYTAGFPDGQLPRVVNELIGIQTAMNVLSVLAPTYQKNSTSISIDSMSQSISTPGPELFANRLKDLQDKKDKKVKQLKKKFGTGFVVGHI